MALNIATFKTRAATSGVFVAVMLAGLLINQWSFFLLFSIIHFGCWKEYQKIIQLIDKDYEQLSSFHKFGIQLLGWSGMLYCTKGTLAVVGLSLQTIGSWMAIALVALLLLEQLKNGFKNSKALGYSLLGLLYISLSWSLIIELRFSQIAGSPDLTDTGIFIPFGLVLALWINDTSAYLVGSFIGKTPFSKISQKKTWEGTLGGALLCMGIVFGFSFIKGFYPFGKFLPGSEHYTWAVISVIAAIVGTSGDLLESKLKRMANIKDSGQLMPGHGGFLDRFDSLLLATPFVWIFVKLFI
jgi:phosphatidate cytidylyltransferase